MNATIEVVQGIQVARIMGPMTVETFLTAWTARVAHESYRPERGLICDLRDADLSGLSSADMRSMEPSLSPIVDLRGIRVACVVSRPVDFGVVRMWMAFEEDIAHQVFYSMQEALTWLGATG